MMHFVLKCFFPGMAYKSCHDECVRWLCNQAHFLNFYAYGLRGLFVKSFLIYCFDPFCYRFLVEAQFYNTLSTVGSTVCGRMHLWPALFYLQNLLDQMKLCNILLFRQTPISTSPTSVDTMGQLQAIASFIYIGRTFHKGGKYQYIGFI